MEKENFWLKIIYILSAVLSLAVGFLILGPRPDGIEGAIDVSGLPYVNAFLNLITTTSVSYTHLTLPTILLV